MAKKEENVNIEEELRRLKTSSPGRLYTLWGDELYLKSVYIDRLMSICLPNGDDGFSYKVFTEPEPDYQLLTEAVSMFPFLSERTVIELKGIDINKLKEPDRLLTILNDIPDYCTVIINLDADYSPDSRTKVFKQLKSSGREIHFSAQNKDLLFRWISQRFGKAGKSIGVEAAQRLVFLCGDLMTGLIPEIDKIIAYSKGPVVGIEDVNAAAVPLPEANVFEMTDYISKREFKNAMSILNGLLENKDNEPIVLVAIIANQLRRLYAASIAIEKDLGVKFLVNTFSFRYDGIARDLIRISRSFSKDRLKKFIRLCVQADYKLKSSTMDDSEIVRELVIRLMIDEKPA